MTERNEGQELSAGVSYHRRLWRVEASGVRTAAAAVLPLIAGQVLGYPAIGLAIGLGGLYLSITDKEGSTPFSLLAAVGCNALAAMAGTWIGNTGWFAVPAMFVWAFFGGMASAYGTVISQIGFVMTIVFAVSLNQAGDFTTGLIRAGEFAAGGLWGVLLTLWLRRSDKQTGELIEAGDVGQESPPKGDLGHWMREKFALNFTSHSTVFRHALALALASSLAILLYLSLRLERGYWLIITVLVIVKPEFSDTRKRAAERVLGSIVGGALAAMLAASIHNVVALDLLLIMFSTLAYSHVRHNYGVFVMFLTPCVVLMIDIVHPTPWQIVLVRIFDTIIGGLLALIVAFWLRSPAGTERTES